MTARARSRNITLALGALAGIVVLIVAVKVFLGGGDGGRSRRNSSDLPGERTTSGTRVRVRDRDTGRLPDGTKIISASGDGGSHSLDKDAEKTNPDDAVSSGALVVADDGGTSGSATADTEVEEVGNIVVSGTVFDGETPASGATVTATEVGKAKRGAGTVDEKGFYKLSKLPPGEYVFTAESEKGVLEKRLTLVPEIPNVTLNFDFAEEDELGKFPIIGVVIKKKDGTPVPDATIELQDQGQVIGTTRTTGNGTFEILSAKNGTFTINARAGFFLPGQLDVVVADGKADPESVVIELNGTGALRVQVLTPQGLPAGGALVSLFVNATFNDPLESYGSWQTFADGTREIEITAPTSVASFRIGAYKAGYIPGWSQDLSTSGAFESVLRVTLGAGVRVRGRIVDKDSAPIDAASITVKEGFMRTGVVYQRVNEQFPAAASDAAGGFELGPLEPGAVTLGFGAEGYVSDVKTFMLGDPVLDVGDIVLEGNDDNAAERVFGVIVDQDGVPMVSHNVYMKSTSTEKQYYARTDSRGGFKIDKVVEGEYVIYTNGSALRDGIYITLDQVYPFAKPGESGGLYLVYDMGQSLTFSVQSAGGEAVRNYRAGINVRYAGASGFGGTREEFGVAYEKAVTSGDGSARLDHLISGTGSLVIQAEGYGAKRVDDFAISVGGPTDLGVITLESGSKLRGTGIADENKQPLEGVTVRAAAPPGSPPQHPLNALSLKTTTNAGGEFELANIPSGSASLILTKSGRIKTQLIVTVAEDDDSNAGTIPLALGARLRGTVTDANGAVLPDILIVAGEQAIYTDRDGKYFYDTLAAGTLKVIAEDRTGKYPRQEMTVTLGENSEAVADFRLGGAQTPVTDGPP